MNSILVKCCLSKLIEGESDNLNLINLLSIIASECEIAPMEELRGKSNTMYTSMGIFINNSIKLLKENKKHQFLKELKSKLIQIENYEAIVELKLEIIL